jgi:hypothetical protein
MIVLRNEISVIYNPVPGYNFFYYFPQKNMFNQEQSINNPVNASNMKIKLCSSATEQLVSSGSSDSV